MGFDAFRLIPLLARSDDALYGNLPAMTGILHMDEFGRIRRELYWAKFAGGLPRLLPDATDKTASQEVIHADGIAPAR